MQKTDITQQALESLGASRVRRVLIVGRRGPLQIACTIKVQELFSACQFQQSFLLSFSLPNSLTRSPIYLLVSPFSLFLFLGPSYFILSSFHHFASTLFNFITAHAIVIVIGLMLILTSAENSIHHLFHHPLAK